MKHQALIQSQLQYVHQQNSKQTSHNTSTQSWLNYVIHRQYSLNYMISGNILVLIKQHICLLKARGEIQACDVCSQTPVRVAWQRLLTKCKWLCFCLVLITPAERCSETRLVIRVAQQKPKKKKIFFILLDVTDETYCMFSVKLTSVMSMWNW